MNNLLKNKSTLNYDYDAHIIFDLNLYICSCVGLSLSGEIYNCIKFLSEHEKPTFNSITDDKNIKLIIISALVYDENLDVRICKILKWHKKKENLEMIIIQGQNIILLSWTKNKK